MSQISMFDLEASERYKIRKPIRLIELFAGIGSQAKALRNLGANFEHYGICEFDKYAVQSYNEIHGTSFATSDITKISGSDLKIVDTGTYEYIMTYSFPCIDLSLAGNRQGMAKGSGTRSGLLWEVERLLGEITELPQILLMENVPQVLNKDFGGWLEFLESKGYTNHYAKLNAKDYGIPQNRERVFMVSILGKYLYEFPEKIPLKLRLKDMLEEKVDEKYYISEKMLQYFNDETNRNGFIRKERFNPHKIDESDIAFTITTNAGSRPTDNFIIDNDPIIFDDFNQRVKADQTAINTLTTNCGSTAKRNGVKIIEPIIVEDIYNNRESREYGNTEPTLRSERQGLKVKEISTICLNSKVNGKQPSVQDRIYDIGGVSTAITTGFMPSIAEPQEPHGLCPTIDTMSGGGREPKIIVDKIVRKVEIRKNEVDIEGLQKILRENKSLSCKNIAEKLGIPQTKAEHWFRVDSGFAIPDREIWLELKELLGITDNSFDAQIMEFEIIDNNYDMGNRTYDMNGLSPTITGTSTPLIKKGIRIPENTKKGYAIAEPKERFFRQAREAANENERKSINLEQSNIKNINSENGIFTTLGTNCGSSTSSGGGVVAMQNYRIRKLTPKECWRLMGFADSDFDKTTCSNAQLYKQAGNSIVVNVLMAIFRELL